MYLIRPSWQHSPIAIWVRYITHPSQQVFAERGAFHPISKRVASFYTLATRTKQTLACPTLAYLATILCDLSHQTVRRCVWDCVAQAFCQTPVYLYGSYAGLHRLFLFQGLTDFACVHVDGQIFSYHGISYHSVCTMGDQPFYAKGPRPLLQPLSRVARGKITISGIPNRLNYCTVFVV